MDSADLGLIDDDWPFSEAPRALGIVPETGRGSLPFALLRGESLLACASWAVGDADVELLDFNVPWDDVRRGGRPLVVHDPLCPLTPASFIAEAAARAAAEGVVVVGVRPVTDTVKETDGDRIGRTHDRDGLHQVVSPLVLPAGVLAELPAPGPDGPLDLDDLPGSARALAAAYDVVWLEAPAEAARVSAAEDLVLLEARGALSDGPDR